MLHPESELKDELFERLTYNKSKFNVNHFLEGKFLGFYAVVLVKTFRLMNHLLM